MKNQNTKLIKKTTVTPLFWKCLKTKQHTYAGHAIFNKDRGSYRIRLANCSNNEIYYLTPKAAEKNKTYFELERIITNRTGKLVKKYKIGSCSGRSFLNLTVPPFSGYTLTMRILNENK